MTPQQYLQAQLTAILTTLNPAASAQSIQTAATEFSQMYIALILPNLQVDLTTGAVTFVAPAGS